MIDRCVENVEMSWKLITGTGTELFLSENYSHYSPKLTRDFLKMRKQVCLHYTKNEIFH